MSCKNKKDKCMSLSVGKRKASLFSLLVVSVLAISSCDQSDQSIDISIDQPPKRSFEDQVGTRFSVIKSVSFQSPVIKQVPVNFATIALAIWGAIGRDDQGKLYLGASSDVGADSTAFLYQFDPVSLVSIPQGDTLEQLQSAGLYKPGMTQNKLHSKFYQADDGYIYFASFDEQGVEAGVNPIWGGHLWRKLANDTHWQHLLSAQEGLVAVNAGAGYVYALGFWDHVLYQFDTRTQQIKQVVVGSVKGHMSRNLLVDQRGHAFVPNIATDDTGTIVSHLNEYDSSLNLVGSWLMPSYIKEDMGKHHGIIGYTSRADGSIVFTTSDGGLYVLDPGSSGEEKLTYRGMMHPSGEAYIPSLFSLDGKDFLAGVANLPGGSGYEWIIYELQYGVAATYALDNSTMAPFLYGTLTRDDAGNFYLVGGRKDKNSRRFKPVLLQIPLESLWSIE
jgi:hypothetical protein